MVAMPRLDRLGFRFVRPDYTEIIRVFAKASSPNFSEKIVRGLPHAQMLVAVIGGPPTFVPAIGEQLRKVVKKTVRVPFDFPHERAIAQKGTNPGRTANK